MCQASTCVDGLCTIACPQDPSDRCPQGTVCAKQTCQLPLAVGFLYPGEFSQEEYTLSFERARDEIKSALAYSSLAYLEDVASASTVHDSATSFLAQGRPVIVATSPSHGPLLLDFADENPDATLFVVGARVTRPNLVSFDTRTYQAYYLAGIAAARKTTSHRLGMIGSSYTPSVLASINAFALGARAVDPANVVALKWIGAAHDMEPHVQGKSRERIYTEQLLADGADVIAHTLDNNIPVYTVAEQPTNVLAIAANVPDACEIKPSRCLGSVYFNWGPLLISLLDGYHRQRLPDPPSVLEGILVSRTESSFGFLLSDGIVGAPAIQLALDDALTALASDEGVGRVFDGPLQSTGQCEAKTGAPQCVPSGARLDDAGLRDMCWLVQGIVERSGGVDAPALVPELGDCAPSN
ncbi:MAG: BMP family ABC transporter substrate-binding protein [Polyangiaceae bacterium]